MGIFREAGRKFEETKRSLLEGEDAEFVCTSCEEPLTQSYESCPYCEADTVEATD